LPETPIFAALEIGGGGGDEDAIMMLMFPGGYANGAPGAMPDAALIGSAHPMILVGAGRSRRHVCGRDARLRPARAPPPGVVLVSAWMSDRYPR
jgi:hypothetical protein